MIKWESLSELFACLNESVDYLVLRNYETFLTEKCLEDHPDIDLLCSDVQKIVKLMGARPRTAKDDHIHYIVWVKDRDIELDVRVVGDGYYDEIWESDMLRTRVLWSDFCYVMNTENYLYSLIYHGLIQKSSLSADYMERIRYLADTCNIMLNGEIFADLESFMSERGYKYTYPREAGCVANFENVTKTMIRPDCLRQTARFCFRVKEKIRRFLYK